MKRARLIENLTPDFMFGSYREVTPDFLQSVGISALLIDIDNTLAPYEQPDPDEEIVSWFGSMAAAGVRVALVSNNHHPRVERFNAPLGLVAFANSQKPRRVTLDRAMEKIGADPAQTAVLGDQLLTDALAGKRIGLRAIIVPPIKDKKNPFFRFKRLCERPLIRRYARRFGYREWMSCWRVPSDIANDKN